MMSLKLCPSILGLVFLFVFAQPALAFGAGNIPDIAKVDGLRFRHGDIEDALLAISMARAVGGDKFSKLMVSRVYFGNWLRDYSQAIDVGTLKSVSSEAIRLLLCVLGFMSFGFGSKEFEVTAERLGCYRPEEHIDNPKNYADNQDARQYYRKLRGPVNEEVELDIDRETGMKNYIANERVGIDTSAGLVRQLFEKSINLGREYRRNHNEADLFEALRLMGTGLHCLEDFLAHSNYVELALIELGVDEVFPHVGSNTRLRIEGVDQEVFPLVTGTFGGVDFLHSVTGEVSDKLTQSEISQLEGELQQSSRGDTSILAQLLNLIPDKVFGDTEEEQKNGKQKMSELQSNAQAAQMENTSISPRDPEEFTRYVQQIFQQVMPAIEIHDDLMKRISEVIEKDFKLLGDIVSQIEEQLTMWVFTIIAPFVLPVINQVKNELATGSSEIIESSRREQHIVFEDSNCSDPTHSMLSKDHFSNILNEIAGLTASKVLEWVVPQLMSAWDNDDVDIRSTLDCIVSGVLHHPAQRRMGDEGAKKCRRLMFDSVKEWWSNVDEDDYRRRLSEEGVKEGENHNKGDVDDCGHGCGALKMRKNFGSGGSLEDRIAGKVAGTIVQGVTGGISSYVETQTNGDIKLPTVGGAGNSGGSSLGEGLLKFGSSLLEGAFKKEDTESHESRRHDNDGSYTESRTEYGRSDGRYEQAEITETQYSDGRERSEYSRHGQDDGGRGYGYQERTETRPSYEGGYEERTERRYESNEDSYEERTERRHGRNEDGYEERTERRYESNAGSYEQTSGWNRRGDGDNNEESGGWRRRDDGDSYEDSSRNRRGNDDNQYGRRDDGDSYGESSRYQRDDAANQYGRRGDGDSYEESSRYQRDDADNQYGRRGDGDSYEESSRYQRDDADNQYGRRGDGDSYGRSEGYGRQEQADYGREEGGYNRRSDNYDGEERREESGGGGFLGGLIDRVGEELEGRRRDNDWGN
ncbi:Het-C-domain-containing protein [Xylariaceae sp. FL0594]|nr:Het-C-domain-containing protein [Xylariaceae sp. FL0594]